ITIGRQAFRYATRMTTRCWCAATLAATRGASSWRAAQTFACCVVEWLNRNPERSAAGRCVGCGDRAYAHDPLLPYGVEPAGHVWLHLRCWPAWYAARKAKAVSVLAAMGISAPVGRPMKREEQAKHPPSGVTRKLLTAKDQFAFQRQMSGG